MATIEIVKNNQGYELDVNGLTDVEIKKAVRINSEEITEQFEEDEDARDIGIYISDVIDDDSRVNEKDIIRFFKYRKNTKNKSGHYLTEEEVDILKKMALLGADNFFGIEEFYVENGYDCTNLSDFFSAFLEYLKVELEIDSIEIPD